jgi:uncharacterized membrane protein YgcG
MRHAAKALMPALACVVAGCGVASRVVPQGGMADRCADFMTRAYPTADIDITRREAAATSLTTIVAKVEGVRTDLPPSAKPSRPLAVECRFDSGILVGFRWTNGPGLTFSSGGAGKSGGGGK